ncbi:MAG: VacJ family lipoprotein [Candidatus Pelagadaptatus aseana]|uniref:MlaA family lipoprotein n=1 Tax=Candidatus Pelagadaptatus aseana TaxID=3120508 RepID=UPI0039B1CEA5
MYSGIGSSLFKIVCLLSVLAMPAALHAKDFSERDPWEGYNRAIYSFNDVMDRYMMRPVATGYDTITPDFIQDRISNIFFNLLEVRNVFNDILQAKPGQAANDTGRFLINSTIGLVGMFDVAEKMGLPKSDGEDFGQTLVVWGVPQGPYVMLPFLGPRTVTSAASFPVDGLIHPLTYVTHVPTRNTQWSVELIDSRASYLKAEIMSKGDAYLFLRDAYLQRRDYLISDGAIEDDFGVDDEEFGFEDEF